MSSSAFARKKSAIGARRVGRTRGALDRLARLECRVRRKTSPHHVARVAETIEKLGAIARDARRQNLCLPGERRNLVALELPNDLQRSVDPVQTRRRRHVLPALQEGEDTQPS